MNYDCKHLFQDSVLVDVSGKERRDINPRTSLLNSATRESMSSVSSTDVTIEDGCLTYELID